MSYEAEKWARQQRVGNARAKQVLIELANCLNDETGLCCPSRDYLHDVTELKAETISNATAHLERIGLIKKHRESCSKGIRIRYELIGYADGATQNRAKPENGLNPISEEGEPENGSTGKPENGLVTDKDNKELEQGNKQTKREDDGEELYTPLSEQIENAQLENCESDIEDPDHVLTSIQMVVLGKTLGVKLSNTIKLQEIAKRQTITVELFKDCVAIWKRTAKGTGYLMGILRNASLNPETVKPEQPKYDKEALRGFFEDCGLHDF